jgi:hypothetical protein
MRNWLKVVLALALVLPLGAFVAGSLVASAADDPAPRDTIIIDESDNSPSEKPAADQQPKPAERPGDTDSSGRGGADDGDEDGDEYGDDDGHVEGVEPTYGEVDDDHSGPGGGGDDGDDRGDDRHGGDDDDDGREGGDD